MLCQLWNFGLGAMPTSRSRVVKRGGWRYWLLAVLVCLQMAFTQQAPAAESNTEQIARWIEQLGDDHYLVRDQASAALLAAGEAAADQLEAALASCDPEVCFRARKALEIVRPASLQSELRHLADGAELRSNHRLLPCWEMYCKLLGNTPDARRLFCAMGSREAELLEQLPSDPWLARRLLVERCGIAHPVPTIAPDEPAPTATVAALLLAGAVCREPPCCRIMARLEYFVHQTEFQHDLHGTLGPALRKLLSVFVSRDWCDSPLVAYRAVRLAAELRLGEGAATCLRLLGDSSLPVRLRMETLLALAALGSRHDVDAIAPLLGDDSTWCGYASNDVSIPQLRDVALLASLMLDGQQPAQYGFTRLRTNAVWGYDLATAGFAEPAERVAALERWQQRSTWVASP